MKNGKEVLCLRKATAEDARMLLDWRNDPGTRANSFQKGKVGWEEHVAYLHKTLADDRTDLFVAEAGNDAVGTGRMVFRGNACILSWTVAPQKRGQGWGKRLLAAMVELLPEGTEFEAEVLENNAASRHMAEAVGMRNERVVNGIAYYKGVKE